MKHQIKINELGRTSSHRKATLRNLSINLIKHKRIRTTLAKAKELRKFIEPIITKAKEGTSHAIRYAFSKLQNKEAVKELFNKVVPAVQNRPGGYTRIFKLGFRRGDNAHICLIELVDFNNTYVKKLNKAKKKKTRRGKGKKGKGVARVQTPTLQTSESKSEGSGNINGEQGEGQTQSKNENQQ